jgi:hypothetical protein
VAVVVIAPRQVFKLLLRMLETQVLQEVAGVVVAVGVIAHRRISNHLLLIKVILVLRLLAGLVEEEDVIVLNQVLLQRLVVSLETGLVEVKAVLPSSRSSNRQA